MCRAIAACAQAVIRSGGSSKHVVVDPHAGVALAQLAGDDDAGVLPECLVQRRGVGIRGGNRLATCETDTAAVLDHDAHRDDTAGLSTADYIYPTCSRVFSG